MTCSRETSNVKGEAQPRADGRWRIAYSTGKDDPVLFCGMRSAISHTLYALFFGRETNDV